MEDYFINIARMTDQPAVVFFDRGAMDPKAYMNQQQWSIINSDFGLNAENLRDKRYDIAMHLTTTAKGLPHIYHHGNEARYETAE